MSLSKKHYVHIARILREGGADEFMVDEFADYLEHDNERFDRKRFREAALPEKRCDVFHRTWWRENPAYPDGLEPHAGEKHYIKRDVGEDEARRTCAQWNKTHDPGPLSDKAEYEEV